MQSSLTVTASFKSLSLQEASRMQWLYDEEHFPCVPKKLSHMSSCFRHLKARSTSQAKTKDVIANKMYSVFLAIFFINKTKFCEFTNLFNSLKMDWERTKPKLIEIEEKLHFSDSIQVTNCIVFPLFCRQMSLNLKNLLPFLGLIMRLGIQSPEKGHLALEWSEFEF